MLGVRLETKLETELRSFVKKTKLTRSEVVKQALQAFFEIKKNQAWHDKKTKEAWEDVCRGEIVDEKAIMRFLDSWE